jgi:MoaA/NifB/PqqE/SkfB family radical SAM enzyme
MDYKTNSFTAANALPIKIFKNAELVESLNKKFIPPIHVQFIPTNRCNLNCSFCSCKKRNKTEELPLNEIIGLISTLKKLGCKAVTITGGGEPLMHPQISEIINAFYSNNIKIGLVTNGLLLHRLSFEDLSKIHWCRVSCCDERRFEPSKNILEVTVQCGRNVDWAFSYVVSKNFDPKNLEKYILFANEHNFTHVRVVSDLCDLDECPDMEIIRAHITTDDRLVIYQGRKQYDPGQKKCWISLLKPVIGADGEIYPCCGVQYAHQEQDLDLPQSMCMGTIGDIESIYNKQTPFEGSVCARCYYKNYNDILDQMIVPTEHMEFV